MRFKPSVRVTGNGVASRNSSDYLKDPKVLNQLSLRCPHYDCGFCYAPDNVSSNEDNNGKCNNPESCPYIVGSKHADLQKLCIEQQHELNKLRSQLKRIREIGKES